MQVLIFLLVVTAVVAFNPSWLRVKTTPRLNSLSARKPSPSDDVFDVNKKPAGSNAPKKRYLEEDWQLTDQEDVALQPFRQNVAALKRSEDRQQVINAADFTQEIPNVSMFALVYKFKPAFIEAGMQESINAHKEHCRLFQRIVSDEVIRTVENRGAISLWVGVEDEGEGPVRSEIENFVAADPLISGGAVEKWDILDLRAGDNQSLMQYDELEQSRQ